jgi:hypothetical protein
MDKLEEHIRKNREYFDRYNPPAGIWRRIKVQLNNKRLSLNQWWSIAAIVVVILGTALVLYKPVLRLTLTNNSTGMDDRQITDNPQLKETEIYYKNLVNSLYREATPLLTGYPEIEKELNIDISQIDSICSEIKKDLKDNIANEEVVEALIQNYRIKIRLLEDMLVLLKENEDNPKKNKNYEL